MPHGEAVDKEIDDDESCTGHPPQTTAGNRSLGKMEPVADLLGLLGYRDGSETPAVQRVSPDFSAHAGSPSSYLLPNGSPQSALARAVLYF